MRSEVFGQKNASSYQVQVNRSHGFALLAKRAACRFGRTAGRPTVLLCVKASLLRFDRAQQQNRPVPVPCTQVVRSVDRDVRALFIERQRCPNPNPNLALNLI